MATKEPNKIAAYDPWEEVEYRLPRAFGGRNNDVFVRVNGAKYQIQRGKTVMIPRCVAEVLDNSQAQDDRTAELIDQLTK